ncbi:hypothetical protein [Roseibium sp.]|uniref:hypothetical protein n=1 Tax=Roseibium sp. TaxID=1936156 RepID=UPI003B520E42
MTPDKTIKAASLPIAPMQMASGRVVDLGNLKPDNVYWPDLLEGLVKLPRFNGATAHVTYTTAQHCCLMHDRAEDVHKPWALLADFYCAYFGEISRSFRHFAAHLSGDPQAFLESYYLARDEVTATIWEAAGLSEKGESDTASLDRAAYLGQLDKRLTASERRDLMASSREAQDHWHLPEPFPIPVKAWGEDKARAELALRLKMIGIYLRN